MRKLGALTIAISVAMFAAPANALIVNADIASNAGITYGKLKLGGKIDSDDIKNGSIQGKDIKKGTITGSKIDDDAIDSDKIEDESIESADIKDGTITVSDLVAGTLTAASLADGAVTSAKILDSTVASADIAADTIVAADIATGGVGTLEILDGAILTGDIATDTILAADIAADAVATSEIFDGTIAAADLATNIAISTTGSLATTGAGTLSVAGTSALIGATTATGAIYANGGVDRSAAAALTIGGTNATSVIIGNASNESLTVTTNGTGTAEVALPAGSIDGTEILDSTVASADLAADSVAASELADSSVDTGAIINGTIAAADLATDLALSTTGVSALNGGITVDTTNFTVDGATGAVTSASTVTSAGSYISSGGFDTNSAMVLHVGEGFASSVALGSATINTTVTGDLTISGGDLSITPKAVAGTAAEGNVYYDSTDDNLYVYANGGWVDLTAGAAGAITLDEAYNTSAGASTVLVDAGDLTLRSDAGATGDIIVDLNSTGDFQIQNAGVTYATFDDSGNVALTGTLDVQGDVSDSVGTFTIADAANITGATTLDGDVTLGNAATDIVTVTGTIAGASPLVFEGLTADAFETTMAITDGADATITFPATTGTVVTTGDTGTVTSTMILDATIAAGDLAADSVTASKIGDGEVGAAEIATSAVTTTEILDATIVTGDIATDTILAGNIATGAVGTLEIADGTVAAGDLATDIAISTTGSLATTGAGTLSVAGTSALIGATTATGAIYANGGVDRSAAAALTIGGTNATSVGIGNVLTTALTITTDGTGTAEVALPAGSIDSTEILDSTVASADIAADTIVADDIATGGVATDEILNGTILAGDLAADAVTSAKILDATIVAGDLVADTIDGASLADTITLDAAFAMNGANMTFGDGTGETLAINTTDWDIDATGAMTGIGAITMDGALAANAGITVDTTAFTVADTTGDVATAGDLDVNGEDIDSDGSMDITGATGMNINTGAGDITLDPAGNDVLPGGDSADNLGADATRWSTIYADTLNYSAALTDANAANTTVTLGDSNTLDTVNVTAKTAISSEHWSVTEPGVATFVSVDGPIGSVAPAAGVFTTATATGNVTMNDAGADNILIGAAADTVTIISNTLTLTDDNWSIDAAGAVAGLTGITSAMITDSTVASADIAADTIVAADIATDAVTTTEILDSTIASADIAADTIAAADIATGAVTTTEILDTTIAGGDLAADIAITTSGTLTSTGTVDFSGASLIVDSGLTAAIPGTCTVGQLFVATDGAVGSRLMVCTATNTWAAN